MTDLIRWEYAGIEFKVSPALTPDQRDGVCSVLLADYDRRVGSDRVSEYSQTVSKTSDLITEGMSPTEHEDRLESVGEGLDEIVETLNRCRVCSKVIQPTGRRGRPRVMHESCKS